MALPSLRLSLLAAVSISFLAAAAPAWELPAFSADPKQLLAEAKQLGEGKGLDVEVLTEQTRIVLDAQGRSVRTHRLVYRVLTADGARHWALIREGWSPWHEARPEVRARVITSDGVAHPLDPRTLAEAAESDEDPDVFTDRRVLRGPLPAIAAGAIVEEESVVRETAPLFEAGISSRVFVGQYVPVRSWSLRIEAPAALPLQTLVQGRVLSEKKSTERGLQIFEYRAEQLATVAPPEPLLPPEETAWPYVGYATAGSWKALAAAYAKSVDVQLGKPGLHDEVRSLVGDARDRKVIAQRLLSWVQQNVRYTGLELGEAALIPRAPTETLQRHYGDCKDLSALLVAMLREAGLTAELALLRASGDEVNPKLPGIGLFDHAIVHVSGSPELWIDPTHPGVPAGELPSSDQGRLALVARADTTGLTRTPESSAAENRVSITREYFLAERGPSKVSERWSHTGWVAAHFRAMLQQAEPEPTREWLSRYVSSAHDGQLSTFQHSDVEDPTVPFTLTVEATSARRGFTADDDAAAMVPVGPLLEWLPEPLSPPSSEGEGDGDGDGAEATARKGDLVHREPHVAELTYLVHPPPGFTPKTLPEGGRRALGPLALDQAFQLLPDGTVEAKYRLEVSSRRFTAAEVNEARAALTTLAGENARAVSFEFTANALLQQGQVKESLAALRSLVALHPKEALHHQQLASALLTAGYGEEAREEGRRAIALEPSSADAHRALAWTLEHDGFGRRLRGEFDLPGAVAEYRTAKQLDPKDVSIRAALAILLEHDATGSRYAPGAKLDEAIAEYEGIRTELKSKDWDRNLLFALFWAKRFDALRTVAAKLEPSEPRDALLVAAAAIERGADAATAEAAKLIGTPERRRGAIASAVPHLVRLRQYATAATLLQRAAKGASNPAALQAQAAMFAKVKRHEELSFPESDPTSVVRELFVRTLGPDADRKRALELFSERVKLDASTKDELVRGLSSAGVNGRTMEQGGLSMENAIDLALAAIELNVDGDERSGFRVRVRAPLAGAAVDQSFFVVKERGHFRLRALGAAPALLGDEALARVEAGDLAGARRWLDWARELYPAGSDGELPATASFAAFWNKGSTSGKDETRLAAATLSAFSDDGRPATAILERARKGASGKRKLQLDLALAAAHLRLSEPKLALGAADRAIAAAPERLEPFFLKLNALRKLGDLDGFVKAAQTRLGRDPNEAVPLSMLSLGQMLRGDFAASRDAGRKLVAIGKATAMDYNNLAWNALFLGPVGEAELEDARRAASLSDNRDPSTLHTLATIYAETGRATEARELLLKLLDLRSQDDADGGIHYLSGRIAEDYGLLDAARRAYGKIEPASGDLQRGSVYELAQRRLVGLGQVPPLVGKPVP